MKKYRIAKLFGIAFLIMISLVAISFFEVFIFSLFNPGHEQSFYEAHAQASAPWVSGILGCLVLFLIVRYWCKKSFPDLWQLAVGLPIAYVLVDIVVLLLVGGIDWATFYPIFLLANGGKFLGSLGAYWMYGKAEK